MTALELVSRAKVIPVLRGTDPQTVVDLGQALYEEGFHTLEVTLTVPDALDVMRELCRLEDVTVGMGTVLDSAQLEAALEAGAKFLVSPGLEPKLLEAARHSPMPFLPGVFTASEVMQARTQGFRVLKLFPGELMGIKHLKALRGPFPDLHFMPTGGVSAENLHEWFAAGAVAVGMGGSLVSETVKATREKAKAVQAALLWLTIPEDR